MSTISNRTSVYTAYTSDDEGDKSGVRVENAKNKTFNDLQALFNLTTNTTFGSIPTVATATLNQGSLSFKQGVQQITMGLNYLDDKISNCSLDFAPFNLSSSLPFIPNETEEVKKRKTGLANCVKGPISASLDDPHSATSYIALEVSECMKVHSKGLSQEGKREVKAFVPAAMTGVHLTEVLSPLAVASRFSKYVSKIFMEGAVLQGAVESTPFRWVENYQFIQRSQKTAPDLVDHLNKTDSQWVLSALIRLNQFQTSVNDLGEKLTENYRTPPGLFHETVHGVIDIATTVLMMGVAKGTIDATISTVRVTKNAFAKLKKNPLPERVLSRPLQLHKEKEAHPPLERKLRWSDLGMKEPELKMNYELGGFPTLIGRFETIGDTVKLRVGNIRANNPPFLSCMESLKETVRKTGANNLEIEAWIINKKLLRVLDRRYGVETPRFPNEIGPHRIKIPLDKSLKTNKIQ